MKDLGKLFSDVSRRHGCIIHNAVSKLGVGRGMPPMLAYIRDHDGCKQAELSKLGHVSPATVTVMLQSLEKNGCITRRPDTNDQRCSRIYITQKGIDIAREGKETIMRLDEEFFSCLSAEEKEALYNILQKLAGEIEDKCERTSEE